jgi:hypothetical protein
MGVPPSILSGFRKTGILRPLSAPIIETDTEKENGRFYPVSWIFLTENRPDRYNPEAVRLTKRDGFPILTAE